MSETANNRIFESQAEIYNYLRENGRAWTYSLRWEGGYANVGPFSSREECDRQMAIELSAAGYTVPKFWQFWRWGERRPSKRVLELLNSPAKLQEGNTE